MVTNGVLQITALLVVPLPSVLLVAVDVDLHAELRDVVVVGLVGGPRLITDPGAVVPYPGPRVALLALRDSDPVVRALRSVGQQRDQMVVLLLALDGYHVGVFFPTPLPGLAPVFGLFGGVIPPAMGPASQVACLIAWKGIRWKSHIYCCLLYFTFYAFTEMHHFNLILFVLNVFISCTCKGVVLTHEEDQRALHSASQRSFQLVTDGPLLSVQKKKLINVVLTLKFLELG